MPSNVESTQAELETLPDAPAGLSTVAQTLAAGMDDPKASLAMKAMAAKEWRETMNRIRELAPPKPQENALDHIRDDLAKRRDKHSRSTKAQAKHSS